MDSPSEDLYESGILMTLISQMRKSGPEEVLSKWPKVTILVTSEVPLVPQPQSSQMDRVEK